MYKLDFDEELDDDLEKNLLNIEKYEMMMPSVIVTH